MPPRNKGSNKRFSDPEYIVDDFVVLFSTVIKQSDWLRSVASYPSRTIFVSGGGGGGNFLYMA